MADPKSTTPVPDWLQVEAVRRQILLAADALAVRTRDRYITTMEGMIGSAFYAPLESPLEAIFFAWWEAMYWDMPLHAATYMQLEAQREVIANGSVYRLDFVISLSDPSHVRRFEEAGRPYPLIAVEVDGHEFHEKTKEQVAYRNRRDRDLQREGWKVFHFSWSEMVSNGAEAVGSVIDCAINEWMACDKVALDKWYSEHPAELEKLHESIRQINADADASEQGAK